ncbi:hypothetical protein RJZ57_008470, partial [Blastomyces gilchristii]
MADLGAQQGRNYRPPPQYGHASSFQRDAAYSEIFGATPTGRAQTMTSQTPPFVQDRARTMSSHTAGDPYMHPRVAPSPAPPSHMRQSANGYGPPPNEYNNHRPPPQWQPNGPYHHSQPPPQNLPRPYPGRPQYPQPQRLDSRPSPMQPPYPNKVPG